MNLKRLIRIKGGAGSGNWGHVGRPGKRGGSGTGGGLSSNPKKLGDYRKKAGSEATRRQAKRLRETNLVKEVKENPNPREMKHDVHTVAKIDPAEVIPTTKKTTFDALIRQDGKTTPVTVEAYEKNNLFLHETVNGSGYTVSHSTGLSLFNTSNLQNGLRMLEAASSKLYALASHSTSYIMGHKLTADFLSYWRENRLPNNVQVKPEKGLVAELERVANEAGDFAPKEKKKTTSTAKKPSYLKNGSFVRDYNEQVTASVQRTKTAKEALSTLLKSQKAMYNQVQRMREKGKNATQINDFLSKSGHLDMSRRIETARTEINLSDNNYLEVLRGLSKKYPREMTDLGQSKKKYPTSLKKD